MTLKLEDLQLIHFADPRMTTKPPEFDFQKDGDIAEELATILHKRMLQLGGLGLSANQVGIAARVVLHEYDHMEGLNFTHHASNFKLRWELNKLKKKNKKLQRRMKHGK